MNIVKVSVIMPIHNTPVTYLRKAVEDVLRQDMDNYEFICVDDASDSMETVEYLKKLEHEINDKLQVYHFDGSKGAAEARNYGLSKANGEYVIFLDSDDRFSKNMLRIMYDAAKSENADVCLCNYESVFMDGTIAKNKNYKIDKNSENWLSDIPTNPWTRLTKKKYIDEQEVYFQSLDSCNDVYYSVVCLLLTEKICALSDQYLVRYSVGRLGAISTDRDAVNLWRAVQQVINRLKKENKESDIIYVDALLLKGAVSELNSLGNKDSKRKLYYLLADYFKEREFRCDYNEVLRQAFVLKPFENEWYEHLGDFLYQLISQSETLLEMMKDKDLYLCGMGRRGKAFLEWTEKEGIVIKGVSDKYIDSIVIKKMGQESVGRGELLAMKDCMIVASNMDVYTEIRGKTKNEVLNLQEYCPL